MARAHAGRRSRCARGVWCGNLRGFQYNNGIGSTNGRRHHSKIWQSACFASRWRIGKCRHNGAVFGTLIPGCNPRSVGMGNRLVSSLPLNDLSWWPSVRPGLSCNRANCDLWLHRVFDRVSTDRSTCQCRASRSSAPHGGSARASHRFSCSCRRRTWRARFTSRFNLPKHMKQAH